MSKPRDKNGEKKTSTTYTVDVAKVVEAILNFIIKVVWLLT